MGTWVDLPGFRDENGVWQRAITSIAADCLDPDCLLIRIDAGEPIEVGQPFVLAR
jgi:hypothetical protein